MKSPMPKARTAVSATGAPSRAQPFVASGVEMRSRSERGRCRVVAPSMLGLEYVIVEWLEETGHWKPGDVSVLPLFDLEEVS